MLQKNFTTVVMEESMNKQSGFTLIELIVTMCLSGLFLSFALQYYLSALRVEKNIREEIELEIAIDNQALYWNAYGSQRKLAKNYYKQRKQIA